MAANTEVGSAQSNVLKAEKVPPFGFKDKIGYAFGDVGTTFIMGVVASFQAIYFTNVLGISPVIVGIIGTITSLVGACTDLIVGRLSDVRKLGKKGRFHPWIRAMKWPLGLSLLIFFCPIVRDFTMTFKLVYLFAACVFYAGSLSSFNIPYGSLAAAISSNPDDRTSLSVYRSVGSAIGAGGTGFILPYVVYTKAANGTQLLSGDRLFIASIVCAGIAMIAYSVMYNLTTERVVVQHKEKTKISTVGKSLLKNRALISFLCAEIVIVFATGLVGFMTTYVFTVIYQSKEALSIALLFNYANVIVLAPFAKKLTEKFGKKEVVSIALFVSSLLYFAIYFMQINNPWFYLVMMFFSTLCFSMFNIMIWSFMTDVIDYHQYASGLREEGTVYSFNMFGRKISQIIAASFNGFALGFVGYVATSNGSTTQSPAVLKGMYTIASIVPAVLLLFGALILALWFPLNKKTLAKVAAKLKVVNQTEK